MRIFLAGATGVIGVRLLRLMAADGHVVAGMTRTPAKMDGLRADGVTPILCDLFDLAALRAAVKVFQPELIIHQATDLPDELSRLPEFISANNRVRSEGTQNLLAAARMMHVSRFIAQSIAWSGGAVVDAHESAVLEAGGVVLRYGQFYGPGTYYESAPPPEPRVHVDVAASKTMQFLTARSGIFTVTDVDASASAHTAS